jgi:KTSC domain
LRRIELESTALAWVRYLPDARVLQVGLRSGRDYDYFDVPAEIYTDLLAAESQGRYYNHHIRNAFHYEEVHRRKAG